MAGLAAVLTAVARAQWRDLRSLQSIAGNNFFLFVLLLMQDPKSGAFLALLIGGLILVPLAADPLRVVPPDRLVLWPFSRMQFVVLRVASLALSPVVWIIAVIAARSARLRPVLEVAAVFTCIEVVLLVSKTLSRRAPRWNVLRAVPPLPGTLGELVRKDIRQILCTLDFYIAGLLALAGVAYRLLSFAPDPAAIPVLSLLVVLAMSTYAQCLFGLDGPGGLTRYHFMPVAGWRILLAKDLAWLAVLFPLVIALDPMAGFAGAFAALAVGHHASVRRLIPQQRWPFMSGSLLPVGVIQVGAMFASETAVGRISLWFLPGAFAMCLGSLFLYGLLWGRYERI